MTEDCRSKEGAVVGVVDAFITLSRVFAEKVEGTSLGSHPEVRAALLDLARDEGFELLRHEMAHAEARRRRERGEKLLAAATDAASRVWLVQSEHVLGAAENWMSQQEIQGVFGTKQEAEAAAEAMAAQCPDDWEWYVMGVLQGANFADALVYEKERSNVVQCAHCGSRNIVPDSDTGDATCGDCRRSDGVVEMTEDQWTRK